MLAETCFEPGYLDDSPLCHICGGTGYVGSNMCECLRELCRQEQKKEVSILSGSTDSFQKFRLDYYPDRIDPKYGASPRTIMERNFQCCRRYALSFSGDAGNLLFVGGTGLGKTFLSACIARTVADRGFSVAYETANHLFGKLEQAKFNPSEESRREADMLLACDLLIIDDLGTEFSNSFTTSQLFLCLNERLLRGKSTVISTNLPMGQLREIYSERTSSRIFSNYQLCKLFGDDIRIKKKLSNEKGV